MSEALVKALQNPELYDHPVANFQLLETHISWVLLTGEFVYKIKKPMNFGFLDFSTLAQRRHFCEEELRLNRRLLESVYLKVVAIGGSEDSPEMNTSGEAIEYAVQMRQFDPSSVLDQLDPADEALPIYMKQLAHQIADFHTNDCAIAADDRDFGKPEQVFAPMAQNFEQIEPMLEDGADKALLKLVEQWAGSEFKRLTPLLASRREKGYVRECHGDMHLGNVAIINGKPSLFDCIEFNEDFRWIDTINDLAFLLMDLQDRGLDHLAYRVLNIYLEDTGDFEGVRLLNFYKSYRAMVRCKIALFTAGNEGIDAAERDRQLGKARQYLRLAERYMSIPRQFLIISQGLSGSGKTTVSTHLLEHLKAVRVRSDVERKRLHGFKPLDNTKSSADAGIYAAESTEQTYTHLADTADLLLKAGRSVILDATFLKEVQRGQMRRVAELNGVPFAIMSCQAEENILRERVQARKRQGKDAAEADISILERQIKALEPFTEAEQSTVISVCSDHLLEIDCLAKRLATHLDLD
ncbi:AAA family ATPase [Allohahella marinimesophila]|uniref:AAA family ATPase n=1 Tax=Allohahella marinimesophila TaxID=1054972 RepID=A0ABP7P5D0_9GAMM